LDISGELPILASVKLYFKGLGLKQPVSTGCFFFGYHCTMDKSNLYDTLLNLQKELAQRLVQEINSTNNIEKVAEYNRQLQQIQNEIDRIKRGRSYSQ